MLTVATDTYKKASDSSLSFVSTYASKPVNLDGKVEYTRLENLTWYKLFTQQESLARKWACTEYIKGLDLINFPKYKIPQCNEISNVLSAKTGWSLEPVPSLIPNDLFFSLLSQRKFPAATFIRRTEDFGYVPEPDIFHEMFGHCPLLADKTYADFAYEYGRLCLNASSEDRDMLAKIYWFTFENGLIQQKGLKAYGGSILSSVDETIYALASNRPRLKPFNILEVLRTPYRIDILQPVYFVIENFNTLYRVLEMDLPKLFDLARNLGFYKMDNLIN